MPLSAGPELADIAAALAKSGARSAPMRTPPRASGKKLRRSLEDELEAERAKPNGWFTHGAPTESGAVGGEVAFDRALYVSNTQGSRTHSLVLKDEPTHSCAEKERMASCAVPDMYSSAVATTVLQLEEVPTRSECKKFDGQLALYALEQPQRT